MAAKCIALSPEDFLRGLILMNALTAVKQPDDALSRTITGFSIAPSVQSPRLLELTFCAEVTQQFQREVEQWPAQPLEYKSFLRFKIAKILDDMCGNYLQPLLLNTLLNRDEGVLQIGAVGTYRRKRAGTHLAKRRWPNASWRKATR